MIFLLFLIPALIALSLTLPEKWFDVLEVVVVLPLLAFYGLFALAL